MTLLRESVAVVLGLVAAAAVMVLQERGPLRARLSVAAGQCLIALLTMVALPFALLFAWIEPRWE